MGAGRVVALADEVFINGTIGNLDNQVLMNRVVDWLAGPSFLIIDDLSGVIPPGQTQDVDVTFDAHDLFGGDYGGHYDNEMAGITLVDSAKQHPVLAGVRPFVAHGSLYKNRRLAADTQVLLTGSFPDHSHPVAWTRPNQSGRVFCTSLGHPADFHEPDFLRLLTNAIFWTTRQEQPG